MSAKTIMRATQGDRCVALVKAFGQASRAPGMTGEDQLYACARIVGAVLAGMPPDERDIARDGFDELVDLIRRIETNRAFRGVTHVE